MAIPDRVRRIMKANGLTEVNKPKRTPRHRSSSYVVMASQGGKYELVRFGQQGASPAGSNPKTEEGKAKRRSFRARFRKEYEQKAKGNKFSPLYWAWHHLW